MSDTTASVRLERHGDGTATIRLSRPEKRNALSVELVVAPAATTAHRCTGFDRGRSHRPLPIAALKPHRFLDRPIRSREVRTQYR